MDTFTDWILWPAAWYAIAGIVAFALASFAAQSWRELGVLVAISAVLVFPIKWLGPRLGLPVFGEDAIAWRLDDAKGWVLGASFSAAVIAAIILAALAMIAWREFCVRRAEKARD
jgi:hypothetical protein